MEFERRKFLQICGLTASGLILPAGVTLAAPPEAPPSAQAKGMLSDLTRCIGCGWCQQACKEWNHLPAQQASEPSSERDDPCLSAETWTLPELRDIEENGQRHQVFVKRQCMHCLDPACVSACPVGALQKLENGAVVYDCTRCIGCRYCMVACPYDARRFNWEKRTDENPFQPQWGSSEVERRPRGVPEKCTFCIHRIDRGLEEGLTPGVHRAATPACVNICPVGARKFGDLHDPESEVAQIIATTPTFRLREDLGTEPNVYYIPAEGMVIS